MSGALDSSRPAAPNRQTLRLTPRETARYSSAMTRHFSRIVATLGLVGVVLFALPAGCTSPRASADGMPVDAWVPIFNGRDLTGWTPKFAGHAHGVNYLDTFRVEDGVLKVSYDDYDDFGGAFGHLFHEGRFSHYRLRLEYRFVGEQTPGAPGWAYRNSGVMIHGQSPETMGLDQSFPVSVEVQLLGGGGTGERPTGNVCTPGTHIEIDGVLERRHCINSTSRTFHGDDWVSLEIEVRGGEIVRHLVNGVVVMEYTRPQLDANDADAAAWIERREGVIMLDGGSISLQAESHPCQFRHIEMMRLSG